MNAPLAGIREAAWLSWPPEARAFIHAQHQENDDLRSKLTALATELASLRERIARSSRNTSKPPSRDSPGFKPPERRKGSGRKRGGRPGHPGSGPELLPIERVGEVVEHHPDACRHCGTLLQGGSSARAPPGDRDSADHAVGDRAPAAPLGLPLLFHQHLRHTVG